MYADVKNITNYHVTCYIKLNKTLAIFNIRSYNVTYLNQRQIFVHILRAFVFLAASDRRILGDFDIF